MDKFNKADVAIAVDRILISKGLPQRYGTIVKTEVIDGNYSTYSLPLESPDKVDELREGVGLGRLEDYLGRAEELYKKIERKE